MVFMLIGLIARLRGFGRGNAARKATRRVVGRLRAIHPKFLARNGDSGWGLDNTTPWYELYLTVDRTPDPEETIRSAAREAFWVGRVAACRARSRGRRCS